MTAAQLSFPVTDPRTCSCDSCAGWRETLARWSPVFEAAKVGRPYRHLLPPPWPAGHPCAKPVKGAA